MRFNVIRFSYLVALLALLTGQSYLMPSFASASTDLELSGLTFKIEGPQTGTFAIASSGGDQAVSYHLAQGLVSFQTLDYVEQDNPLFCFDFSSGNGGPQPQLRLGVDNSNGHPSLDEIGLSLALQYQLSGGEIRFTPGPQTQCFFIGEDPSSKFGLFGASPATVIEPDPDVFFRDGFELKVTPSLVVRYENLPGTVSAGGSFAYRLVVENAGDTSLNDVAFQEVFPGNASVFPAALDDGSWTCTGSDCPVTSGTGLIRLKGASLGVGESLTFEVVRAVSSSAEGGAQIGLYAGAVAGPGEDAAFGADQASVDVIGPPVAIVFTNDSSPVGLGEQKTLTIQIQDANGNLVDTVSTFVDLIKALGSGPGEVNPMSGSVQVTNGTASFGVTGTVLGDLTLRARSEPTDPLQLQTGTTSFAVVAP